jgi:hypothetical protein
MTSFWVGYSSEDTINIGMIIINIHKSIHFGKTTCAAHEYCVVVVGWVDIGTGTKVPLRFVTYLSKVTKINEKSGLTQ